MIETIGNTKKDKSEKILKNIYKYLEDRNLKKISVKNLIQELKLTFDFNELKEAVQKEEEKRFAFSDFFCYIELIKEKDYEKENKKERSL
jgi:hypothetical protein